MLSLITQLKITQYRLRSQNSQQGFSLIELMVVVLIIGVLAALVYPVLTSAPNRARQSQAKINVGSVNRSQQQYRAENVRFATTLEELGLNTSIPATTEDYDYAITTSTATETVFQATSNDSVLLSYAGGVTALGSIVSCQTVEPSTEAPTITFFNGIATCGPNAEPMR